MEQFKVIKEYCGIKKGTTQRSNSKSTIDHMTKKGYWEKIEPTKRLKKIEPLKRKKK